MDEPAQELFILTKSERRDEFHSVIGIFTSIEKAKETGSKLINDEFDWWAELDVDKSSGFTRLNNSDTDTICIITKQCLQD